MKRILDQITRQMLAVWLFVALLGVLSFRDQMVYYRDALNRMYERKMFGPMSTEAGDIAIISRGDKEFAFVRDSQNAQWVKIADEELQKAKSKVTAP